MQDQLSCLGSTTAKVDTQPLVADRVHSNRGQLKKAAIVALARKLVIALWKYITAGVAIEGAVMRTAPPRLVVGLDHLAVMREPVEEPRSAVTGRTIGFATACAIML